MKINKYKIVIKKSNDASIVLILEALFSTFQISCNSVVNDISATNNYSVL